MAKLVIGEGGQYHVSQSCQLDWSFQVNVGQALSQIPEVGETTVYFAARHESSTSTSYSKTQQRASESVSSMVR